MWYCEIGHSQDTCAFYCVNDEIYFEKIILQKENIYFYLSHHLSYVDGIIKLKLKMY